MVIPIGSIEVFRWRISVNLGKRRASANANAQIKLKLEANNSKRVSELRHEDSRASYVMLLSPDLLEYDNIFFSRYMTVLFIN